MKKMTNLSYVMEPVQGLSSARNRGSQETQCEYVAYMDDDAKAPEKWVTQALSIIDQHKPDIFGGPIYPYYITDKPSWFKDEYEYRIHANYTGWLKNEMISGSNYIIRKELLERLGGFDPNIGMKGKELGYGEESALLLKAREINSKIYYSLDLIMLHLVPPFKMNIYYFITSSFKNGYESSKRSSKLLELSDYSEMASIMLDFQRNLEKRVKDNSLLNGSTLEDYIIRNQMTNLNRMGSIAYLHEKNQNENLYFGEVQFVNKLKANRKQYSFLYFIKLILKLIHIMFKF
jgi:hypothetical protein